MRSAIELSGVKASDRGAGVANAGRAGGCTNVSLLRAPVVVLPGSLATHGPTPPIGLAYVAAVLRAAGHDVQVIDGPGEGIEQCVAFDSPVGVLHRIGLSPQEIADRVDPDAAVVGITNMFLHEWPQVRQIVRAVRARLPTALIVLGGENATAFWPWILEDCPEVDCCVLGEGEATMLELVERVGSGQAWRGMAGVAGRSQDQPGTDDGGLSIRLKKAELAQLPWPAWDLFPLENYWSRDPFFGVNRGRSMQMLGTRGCPYKCSFCSSPQMWTTKFVVREPSDVVDEIASYVERYDVRNINFVDLTAATNRRWILSLCDELLERTSEITWQLPVGTRIEGIDREVLERLMAAGCRNITFAPESGSERILSLMDKKADLEHILESVRECHTVGLRTTVNIIVGHPEERWSDLAKSLRFLLRAAVAGGDDTAVIMFCPYPGSRDFDDLVASGRHEIDEASLYVGLSRSSRSHRSWNARISSAQIRWIQLGFIGAFYGVAFLRRPSRIIQFIRSQLNGAEDTYLDQMVRTRRRAIRPKNSQSATPPLIGSEPSLGSPDTLDLAERPVPQLSELPTDARDFAPSGRPPVGVGAAVDHVGRRDIEHQEFGVGAGVTRGDVD